MAGGTTGHKENNPARSTKTHLVKSGSIHEVCPRLSLLVLSAALGLCVMTGFWIAVATRGLYGGTLADAGGIETRIMGIEGNALLFGLIVVMLIVAVVLKPKSTNNSSTP